MIRFDYGSAVPWVTRVDGARVAIAGPNALRIDTPADLRGEEMTTVGEVVVSAGDRVPFVLSWFPSHEPVPEPVDAEDALGRTESFWTEWSGACGYDGEWAEPVRTSIRVLKALTYEPTGGIVAAPTTSLPEWIGSVRNWDYRYCWLRDATLTIVALIDSGYLDEARAWRSWLFRSAAGDPSDLQIMYGVAGERRLLEFEVEWLPGFEGSAPVRVGNAASEQLQLDVYGEVIDAFYTGRLHGLEASDHAWQLTRHLLAFLENAWRRPDAGIWEVRGPNRHFTHSKVMAWVAFDRAVRTVETWGHDGPVEHWRALRDEIHADVCRNGYDADLGTFVQSYGSKRLDASVLLIPLVGFLPPDDPRVIGTVDAIGRDTQPGRPDRAVRGRRGERRGRRAPAGRGRLPAVLVLVRSESRPDRPQRRGERALRTARRPPQRPRPDLGGVRPGCGADARQLPAGIHPSDPRRLRLRAGERPQA